MNTQAGDRRPETGGRRRKEGSEYRLGDDRPSLHNAAAGERDQSWFPDDDLSAEGRKQAEDREDDLLPQAAKALGGSIRRFLVKQAERGRTMLVVGLLVLVACLVWARTHPGPTKEIVPAARFVDLGGTYLNVEFAGDLWAILPARVGESEAALLKLEGGVSTASTLPVEGVCSLLDREFGAGFSDKRFHRIGQARIVKQHLDLVQTLTPGEAGEGVEATRVGLTDGRFLVVRMTLREVFEAIEAASPGALVDCGPELALGRAVVRWGKDAGTRDKPSSAYVMDGKPGSMKELEVPLDLTYREFLDAWAAAEKRREAARE